MFVGSYDEVHENFIYSSDGDTITIHTTEHTYNPKEGKNVRKIINIQRVSIWELKRKGNLE